MEEREILREEEHAGIYRGRDGSIVVAPTINILPYGNDRREPERRPRPPYPEPDDDFPHPPPEHEWEHARLFEKHFIDHHTNISSTVLFTPRENGLYQIMIKGYVQASDAGASAAAPYHLGYTKPDGVVDDTATVDLTATGPFGDATPAWVELVKDEDVTFSFGPGGTWGTAKIDLFVCALKLSGGGHVEP
jgi:hypothetical protein